MPLTGPIAVWLGLWSLKCDVLREILTVFYIYEEVPVKQEASWLKFLFRCFLASTDQDHRHPLVRGSKVKGWLSLFVFCFFFFPLCLPKSNLHLLQSSYSFFDTEAECVLSSVFSGFWFRSENLIPFPTPLTTFSSKPLLLFILFFLTQWGVRKRRQEYWSTLIICRPF